MRPFLFSLDSEAGCPQNTRYRCRCPEMGGGAAFPDHNRVSMFIAATLIVRSET